MSHGIEYEMIKEKKHCLMLKLLERKAAVKIVLINVLVTSQYLELASCQFIAAGCDQCVTSEYAYHLGKQMTRSAWTPNAQRPSMLGAEPLLLPGWRANQCMCPASPVQQC